MFKDPRITKGIGKNEREGAPLSRGAVIPLPMTSATPNSPSGRDRLHAGLSVHGRTAEILLVRGSRVNRGGC